MPNADIVGFQEIFDQAPPQDVVAEADRRSKASNEDTVPDRTKRYAR